MASERRQRGFTLVEMVVGMVVLAIALVLMATLLFPLAERSALGVQRAKGAQLGQAVLAELAGRRLDQATPLGGGPVPGLTCCDDSPAVCAAAAADPSDPGSWELLDRFHDFDDNADALLGGERYDGFEVTIQITCQAPAALGSDWRGGSKLAQVTILTPGGESLAFSQVRGNF
ncbi:prepilin-type N-terminal cleavage/methylation domain-containing protein [Ferrimonas balearica]|uniref:type IV pilus modification PilV family protein n=1 Tax=Ferrimonas balearica TaxID=44012 RepID=UPI001C994CDB|nr:type II secretion system protein [Ferrimonas balearica]MBY5993128.1 type II secretion system GspH family protein [Ferrimonas balearica]